MKSLKKFVLAASLACSGVALAQNPAWKIEVQVDKPGISISPRLYGLMTEEINYSYDGGLYAELIRNRLFKDSGETPVHWSLVQDAGALGTISLDKTAPVNEALSVSLKLSASAASSTRRVGVANEGFWGIPVKPNTRYRASFFARAADGFRGPLSVGIESADGKTRWASAKVSGISGQWKKYSVTLRTQEVAPSQRNRFVISQNSPGTVFLSLISLFPPTYKNRPNGNRIDLMEKMAAMKPAYLRFPGGNYLDPGGYPWKIGIGPVETRPGHMGAWGYRSSDGMGLLEFLNWCEDLKMEPLLCVSDGRGVLPGNGDIGPYVQDALDEIEYVSGDKTTPWGARRAAGGHPAPFQLNYIEIGNEDFFDDRAVYDARFTRFYDAIRAKYPALQIIATRPDVSSRKPDVVDDHFYNSAAQMQRDVHHYDKFDRSGPKIFVGEWASYDATPPWTSPGTNGPTPTLNAALGDAAWMIGLERNSDLVLMHCYAPLLVNVNPGGRQWAQNLIGYDALHSFSSPSYYAQTMFSRNRGDVLLPTTLTSSGANIPESPLPHGAVGVGTWNTQAQFKDFKITQGQNSLYQSEAGADEDRWTRGTGDWSVQGGALVQSGLQNGTRATVGNANWTDYTYEFKARKTGGSEGFLVIFHARDSDNYLTWNIGGWNNTRSAIQRSIEGQSSEIGVSVPGSIETGRWYEVKIELKGRQIRCFLDGKLVSEVTNTPVLPPDPLIISSSRDKKSGEVILKVVNISGDAHEAQIALQGAKGVKSLAQLELLRGEPDDVNTLEQPKKVTPKTMKIRISGSPFVHEFPAHSVSIIRLKTR